jgi:hypothetical protein
MHIRMQGNFQTGFLSLRLLTFFPAALVQLPTPPLINSLNPIRDRHSKIRTRPQRRTFEKLEKWQNEVQTSAENNDQLKFPAVFASECLWSREDAVYADHSASFQWPMLWFLKIFSAIKNGEKLAFLTQNKAKLCKKIYHNIGLWEQRQFFPQKIVENRWNLWS